MRALVMAGGGMRGAYGSGAVTTIHDMGLRFDAVYGTSVGGAMAAWFTAGQADDGLRTWKYARDPRVLNYTRWLTARGPLLDLEYLYNHVYLEEVGLQTDRIEKAKYPVFVTVTHAADGQTHALDLRDVHIPTALYATSAMPLATRGPVHVAGRDYWDGGVTEPVPLARAINDGATDITLVLNHELRSFAAPPPPVVWWMRRHYPALVEPIRDHGRLYAAAERLAADPPEDVTVRMIRPETPTGLGRFTRDMRIIDQAIERGRADAQRVLG